jgi:hypothetical protein
MQTVVVAPAPAPAPAPAFAPSTTAHHPPLAEGLWQIVTSRDGADVFHLVHACKNSVFRVYKYLVYMKTIAVF